MKIMKENLRGTKIVPKILRGMKFQMPFPIDHFLSKILMWNKDKTGIRQVHLRGVENRLRL